MGTARLLRLRPYQREAIDAVWHAWEEGVQRPAIVLATGLGKAQPVDEPVLTPTGWRAIGDLSVGDEVIGSDGRPTRVTGVFPQGTRPTVVVRFTDQTEVRCDRDHLWRVQTSMMQHDANRRGSAAWTTLTAEQIQASVSKRWRAPIISPVHYATTETLPLDPYTLGVLLGDGGLSVKGQVRLHTRHDIVPLLVLPDGHHTTLYHDQGVMGNYYVASGVGRSANLVLNALRELGLHGHTAHRKFVPDLYLRSAPDNRLALLQGILDTDGSVSGSGVEYTTVSKELMDGVAELARSLGGSCRVSLKNTTWTSQGENKRGTAYRAYLTFPRSVIPFRVERKTSKLGKKQFDPVKRIVAVEDGPELECVCISVAADDHLYVTKDYTVTHNTVLFSHLVDEYITKTGGRAVILVHRDELADQALNKLRDVAPHLLSGKVKAKDNEVGADVVVASVQTLARVGRLEQLGTRGLVIADECHHFSSPTFKGVLERLGVFTPGGTKLLGVTATMSRSDSRGLGDVFEDVVYTKGVMYGIKNGYLVKPEGKLIVAGELDLAGVKTSRGDYQTGDLGRAVEESGLADVLPAAYREHANERQGIVFTPTVANAEHVAQAFCAAGLPAAMLSGDTPRTERLRIFEDYRRGKLRVMCNAMVLSEGFDMPQAEVAVIARPTRSNSLYQQMVGRVLRPSPTTGKTGALILDVVGASLDNKLMTLVNLEPGMFEDKAPCRNCDTIPCVCLCSGCELEKAECTCEKNERGEVKLLEEGIQGELDLFSSSSQAWLSTRKNVMFIPCGDGEVFIWPSWTDEGSWRVAHWGKTARRPDWLHGDLPLGTAMAWAETEADERQEFSTRRTAYWRRRKATESQKNYAKRLGIPCDSDTLAGDLGNLISIELASRKLDAKVKE